MKTRLSRMGELLRRREVTMTSYSDELRALDPGTTPHNPMPALDRLCADLRATTTKTLSLFVRNRILEQCFPIDSRVESTLERFQLPNAERRLVSLSLEEGRNPREVARLFYDGPDISEEAKPLFLECLADVRNLLPEGTNYGDWRRLSGIELEDRYSLVFGHLTDDDELRDRFLQAETRLTHAYLLVKHRDDCREFADEAIFYQRVRKQILKSIPGRKAEKEVEQAVRDLVDDSVSSEGVVDIFKTAGIEKPDISILDDKFLQTFKDKPLENLRLKLLQKLLADKIKERQARNLAKAKSFQELLEATLQKYHNRLIDAATVIQAMLEIRKEMDADDARAKELGLAEDELAFYDAVTANFGTVYDVSILRDLVHDVVQSIKRNLKVDWTQPHRESVKAAVRAAVKRVLRSRGVKAEDLESFTAAIMEQAEALYRDWPLAA